MFKRLFFLFALLIPSLAFGAGELHHRDVGVQITKAEFEATDTHLVDSGTTGDLLYVAASGDIVRLGIGSASQHLITSNTLLPYWSDPAIPAPTPTPFPTVDYDFVSGNDGATDVTAAELEEQSDGSSTALHLHDHGGQGGLGDNDHNQYLKTDASNDPITGALTMLLSAVGNYLTLKLAEGSTGPDWIAIDLDGEDNVSTPTIIQWQWQGLASGDGPAIRGIKVGPSDSADLILSAGSGGTRVDLVVLDGSSEAVGFGTDSPNAKVESLSASGAQLRLTFADGSKFVDFTVDTSHDLTITPSSVGQVIFQPTTDSTNFFEILDADGGTPVFVVNSTNESVGINVIPDYLLHIKGKDDMPRIRVEGAAGGGLIAEFGLDANGNLFFSRGGSGGEDDILVESDGDVVLGINGNTRIGDNTTNYTNFSETGDVTYVGGAGVSFGDVYGDHIAWTQASAAQNTWYNISDASILSGELHNVTHDGNGKQTIVNAGMYFVSYSITFELNAANVNVEVGIEVDGSGSATGAGISHLETKFANTEEALSSPAILDLSASATIELTIRTTDGTTPNITVDDVNLTCFQLGGT